jgi:hypothetical protein
VAGLVVAALVVVVSLVVNGASFPPAGPFLLLAVVLGLCMNRFVFFPNEVGVTADAAVIFAAMAAFHDDALWLGPLLAALLVGPLDTKHWEERAFVRMTYNSGSTAIVTLAALSVFAPLSASLGTSPVSSLGAAAVAAMAYLLAESALGVTLVVFQGEHRREAIRHQLPVNMVAVPLALYGAATGVVALSVGWWLAFLMLLPVPLVPELVLVELPRRWQRARRAALLSAVGIAALLVGLIVAFPFPPFAALFGLVVISVLIGTESRVSARSSVPALAAVGVVGAVVVVHGDARILAAVLVAIIATGTSWAISGRPGPWHAPSVAALGALVGAVAYSVSGSGPEVSATALGAATIAGLACILVTDRRPSTAVWCAPVLATSAALGFLWSEVPVAGWALFALGILCTLVTAAAWGALPWRSRIIGGWSYRHLERARRACLVTGAFGAFVTTVTAEMVAENSRPRWLLGVVVCAETVIAMATLGVRQWRFVPRRRMAEATTLTVAALAGGVGIVTTATMGNAAALAIIASVVTPGLSIGWALSVRVVNRPSATAQRAEPRCERDPSPRAARRL